MYKQLAIIPLLALALTTSGCGNSSPSSSGNISGSWNAALTNTDGSPAFTFLTNFTQGGGGTLTVTSLSFTTSSSCFNSGQSSETGSFGFGGNFNGNVTGTFHMTISAAPGTTGSVLTLDGTVAGNTIAGAWTLTGSSGCSGKGSFTINKMLGA